MLPEPQETKSERTEIESAVVVAQVVSDELRPWGLWATLGLSFVVLAAFLLIQAAATIAFIAVSAIYDHAGVLEEQLSRLGTNGLVLSLTSWATLPFTLGLIALFVRLRKPWSLKDYLSLRGVRARTAIVWWLALLLYGIAYDLGASAAGRTVARDMMVDQYATCGSVVLFWLTLTVYAPLFEEVFFRGFMFRGIHQSRIGIIGAVVLTSLLWTLLHIQYELPELLFVFGLGVIFAVARWESNSVYLTMSMHALVNLVALLEVHFFVAS